ncbi:TolC family protein [Ruegeria sp. R14_0]|uniref:TolC family protein n=1 Tax=Ruegeria sp. R14_0 TaxID=2821100 RepID=UPI001ADACA6F|nr:TolC family protein [Ruegeria sp. R14_0]MBO9447511.1 TolC family protein [Ruegeria sp. R14_0]
MKRVLNRGYLLKWVALLSIPILTACAAPPDLTGVERSLSQGSVGTGAQAAIPRLTQSEFGQRVRAAVETNPNLAQSVTQLDVANANQRAAEGAFLPRVSVGMNARSQRVNSDIADVTPYLRVSQLVYDGGAASGDLAAAKARVFESRGGQLQTAASLALAAIEAYVVVLDRRKILAISADNVEVHEEIVRQITKRTSQGVGSSADVLTARSRMADARTQLADATARTERAEAQFLEVFGQPPGQLDAPVEAPRLTRTDAQIVLDSPQVRRADAALLAARAEQTAAVARRQPGIEIAAFADRDRSNDANFGVDLSFNYEIDSTGQRRAAIAAAEAQVREAEFARETLIREIRRELDFIRSDQQAGAVRLQAARLAAQANAESVAAARTQFTIGRRSLIEILDAQRDYVNAQQRLILSEQSFFLTNYAALSLTGDILDFLGISITNWNVAP